ncbi:hypothetical protein FGO68_gene17737 [Halteria grandinella]|uniref:Uncharacterized protein n=1 Tax=Halteria grandinella TaxID=5974 RepID=A0A8J8TA15_HALGN|nr:hypothetical protein FGO68_gene17737 [Halteria grandinella]
MDFIYMDLLQTNIWIDYLIDTQDPEDIALCPSFSLAGFNSKSTIKNLGSSFIFLSILIGILVLILTLKILTFFIPLKLQVLNLLHFLDWRGQVVVSVRRYYGTSQQDF